MVARAVAKAQASATVRGAMDGIFLLQLASNGLVIGLLYALVTVGLALIYGVLEIVNFAHGELIMLGAFAMAFVLPVLGLLYLPSLPLALLAPPLPDCALCACGLS